jgi:hypothetical protein
VGTPNLAHLPGSGTGATGCRKSDGATAKRPADELMEGHRGLGSGQNAGVLPSAQNARHFDIEVLRDGKIRPGGYELPEGFPARRFGDQFDAGRGIDDDGNNQTSPSARSSASVSTARTATGTAGRRSKVSNQVAGPPIFPGRSVRPR